MSLTTLSEYCGVTRLCLVSLDCISKVLPFAECVYIFPCLCALMLVFYPLDSAGVMNTWALKSLQVPDSQSRMKSDTLFFKSKLLFINMNMLYMIFFNYSSTGLGE